MAPFGIRRPLGLIVLISAVYKNQTEAGSVHCPGGIRSTSSSLHDLTPAAAIWASEWRPVCSGRNKLSVSHLRSCKCCHKKTSQRSLLGWRAPKIGNRSRQRRRIIIGTLWIGCDKRKRNLTTPFTVNELNEQFANDEEFIQKRRAIGSDRRCCSTELDRLYVLLHYRVDWVNPPPAGESSQPCATVTPPDRLEFTRSSKTRQTRSTRL